MKYKLLTFSILGFSGIFAEVLESNILIEEEREVNQTIGRSQITQEDIQSRPINNDISEILRIQPGVNLAGNSPNGQRGNNRQVDIRGMGPENTLILIDGKPVTSRNSVRYSWRGQRDTRGDTNWVPAENIESIEVIRGASAAKYGSGALGGVVNIITKKISDKFEGSVNFFANKPNDSKEGSNSRLNLNLSGTIFKKVSYRFNLNLNKTNPDDPKINYGNDNNYSNYAAGREGVKNYDLSLKILSKINNENILTLDLDYGLQKNMYSGDTQFNRRNELINELAKESKETNRMERKGVSVTYDLMKKNFSISNVLSFFKTYNTRYNEGLQGVIEGTITSDLSKSTNVLDYFRLFSEFQTDIQEHALKIGFEALHEKLDDKSSTSQDLSKGRVARDARDIVKVLDVSSKNRPSSITSNSFAFYVDGNYIFNSSFHISPVLRFDHNSKFGNKISPSLNLSYLLNDFISFKFGIANAYKTPNLYQSNKNYFLSSNGNGCTQMKGPCYLQGNDNLKSETSFNKDIGVEFKKGDLQASLSYFHNDYKNKIVSGEDIIAESPNGNKLLQWSNSQSAVIEGLEGSASISLFKNIDLNTNFAYMIQNKNKKTKESLSIIPKYTINSSLGYKHNESLDGLVSLTHYGEQKPLSNKTPLEAYTVFNASLSYKFDKNISFRTGIKNLFNKQILRDSDSSTANTYNEPGRSFFANIGYKF